MHKQERLSTKPNFAQREALRESLQNLFPNFKRVKVKPFYQSGKVIARGKLGVRFVYVVAHYHEVVAKFGQQAEQLIQNNRQCA